VYGLRLALLSLILGATAAACGGSNTTPSAAPSAASVSSAQPSEAQSAAPGAASPAVSASASTQGGQTIALSEWKVVVASTIKAGKTDFSIKNDGAAPHELLVFKSALEPKAYPTDPAGDIVEDGAGVTLVSDGDNIDPGGTQARSVDLVPGTYLFVCNIPGHFKQGMFTVVTVTP
jgi:uncharacterized cupredoxin-like copper-binding protein